MLGLLAENGPCFINPDSNSTTLNPHSWNNEGRKMLAKGSNAMFKSLLYMSICNTDKILT